MEEFDVELELLRLYKDLENEAIANTKETKILMPDGAQRVKEVCGFFADIFGTQKYKLDILKPAPLATHASMRVICEQLSTNGSDARAAFASLLRSVSTIGMTYHLDGMLYIEVNIPNVYASFREEAVK